MRLILIPALLLAALPALAQPPAPPQDARQLVDMPDLPRSLTPRQKELFEELRSTGT